MKLIENWWTKKLTCSRCGETRSVKYIQEGKPLCNRCVCTPKREV